MAADKSALTAPSESPGFMRRPQQLPFEMSPAWSKCIARRVMVVSLIQAFLSLPGPISAGPTFLSVRTPKILLPMHLPLLPTCALAALRGSLSAASVAITPSHQCDNQSACEPCPPHSTTLGEASTTAEQCLCNTGYYNDDDHGVRCSVCMLGTSCKSSGITLRQLPLMRGWWRSSSTSRDVRQCQTVHKPPRGAEARTPKGELDRAILQVVQHHRSESLYDVDEFACKGCESLMSSIVETGVLGITVAALFFVTILVPLVSLFGRYARQLTKWALLRTIEISVLGVPDPVERAIHLPADFAPSVASVISWTVRSHFGIGDFMTAPLQCLGIGVFFEQLILTMMLPVVVMLACILVCSQGYPYPRSKHFSIAGPCVHQADTAEARNAIYPPCVTPLFRQSALKHFAHS